jgi:transcriptional regulator with XRE-family HTH domain
MVAWREDRVRFWAEIARGLSSEEAAAEIGVSQAVGTRWFRHAGGVAPNLSATVSGRYLSFSEREDIALWRAQDVSVREIAGRLGRSPSAISRELRRNASTRTYRLDYRASTAQWHAERRARRPKTAKLTANERLREYVQDRLAGVIRSRDGTPAPGPVVPAWKGAIRRGARTGAGRARGARSRSPAGCWPTSLKMSPCGSRTRRSTRLCMSRAGALCGASWSRAFAPAGRCGSRVPGPGSAPAVMSPPRS